MNFRKITPLVAFALCYLACLLAQTHQGEEGGPLLCGRGESEEEGGVDVGMEGLSVKDMEEGNEEREEGDIAQPVYAASKQGHLTSLGSEGTNTQRKCSNRLLQTTVTSNKFLIGSAVFFQALLLVSRNLILIGIFTNSIDLFLPFLLLSEGFLMLAFWTCQKHYLTNMYTSIFGSYWDGFNAIRLIVQPSTSVAGLPQLSQYGFSSMILFNLSGEFFVGILLLIFTVFSKMTAACLRYERLRRMAANLRAIWNGYFFAILPRVATFTGLHWRSIGMGAGYDAFNIIICILLSAVMVFFFIMLILQTRKINERTELSQQSPRELGVSHRINYKKRFEFDCLKYSSLYYPSMNYIRLVIYFLPIGLSWDFYYGSYGGAIVAQLMMMMIEVSSTGYLLMRDKILFPLQNFLMIIVQLCIITVGLAESVSHSEVSEIAESILFSVLIFVLGSSLAGVGGDLWSALQERCNEKVEQEVKKEDESGHNFLRKLGKSGTVSSQKKSEDSEDLQYAKNEDIVEHSSIEYQKTSDKLTHTLKIKKVRKGKVI